MMPQAVRNVALITIMIDSRKRKNGTVINIEVLGLVLYSGKSCPVGHFACCIRGLIQFLIVLLLIKFPANASLEMLDDGSSAWAFVAHMVDLEGVLGSWVHPGLIHAVLGILGRKRTD